MRKIFLSGIFIAIVTMLFISCAPVYNNELNEDPVIATTYQIDVWNFTVGRNVIIVPENADGTPNFEAIDWRNGENLIQPDLCKKIDFQLGQKFTIYWGANIETNPDGSKALWTEASWPHFIFAENECDFDEYKVLIGWGQISMVEK